MTEERNTAIPGEAASGVDAAERHAFASTNDCGQRGMYKHWFRKGFAAGLAQQPTPPSADHVRDEAVTVIKALIEVADCAYQALDDSEERDGECVIGTAGYDLLDSALGVLNDLPDDRPGYTMGPAMKAEWALRELLAPDVLAIPTPPVVVSASLSGAANLAYNALHECKPNKGAEVQVSDAMRALRSALDDIANSKPLTATPQQFANELQKMAIEALSLNSPPVVAADEPVVGETYLCKAWGETDLPSAAIVAGLDGVRAFLIVEWLGSPDACQDDGTNSLDEALQGMQEQWAREGEASEWSIEFEIGGISVQKVCGIAQQAASGAAPKSHLGRWSEVIDQLPVSRDAAPTVVALTDAEITEAVWQRICELPDRNSPEGEPDACVLNFCEFSGCVGNALEELRATNDTGANKC